LGVNELIVGKLPAEALQNNHANQLQNTLKQKRKKQKANKDQMNMSVR
jgi:hypothetical protein